MTQMNNTVSTKTPRVSAIALSLAAMLVAPAIASAQGGVMRVMVRGAQGQPPMNSCAQLKFMPSPLVDSPEGFEILKMQREIAATRDVLLRSRVDTLNPALQQVTVVGSRVDSAVRTFTATTDGGGKMILRSQNIPMGEGSPSLGVQDRRVIEMMIRELQPMVSDAVRGGIITINVQSTAPGYLGVMTSTSTYPSVLDGSRPFGYCDYPRVETVEPGSPADKVGLAAGDTLLAYNNRDLMQYDVNYQSILVPGKPLHIKFRRDGQTREVSPVVAKRATAEAEFVAARTACSNSSMRAECEGPQQITVRPMPSMRSGMMQPARGQLIPALLYPTGPLTGFLGGADIRVVTEAFGKATGIKSGMMVLEVREGSPAYVAGVREGDVIIAANGTPIRDNNSLSNALAPRMSERTAVLELSNNSGKRKVTMRW